MQFLRFADMPVTVAIYGCERFFIDFWEQTQNLFQALHL